MDIGNSAYFNGCSADKFVFLLANNVKRGINKEQAEIPINMIMLCWLGMVNEYLGMKQMHAKKAVPVNMFGIFSLLSTPILFATSVRAKSIEAARSDIIGQEDSAVSFG